MLNNQIFTYINSVIYFLNEKMDLPAMMLQTTLSLKMETFPQILKTPFNFILAMIFLLFIIIGYANNIICSLIGIIYPIIYGLDLFSTNSTDNNKLILLNKYWILFGGIHLFDSLFGLILNCLPGYFYLKIAFIYLLVRNDFLISGQIFTIFENLYKNSNFNQKIKTLLLFIKTKMNILNSDTTFEKTSESIMSTNIMDKTSVVPIIQTEIYNNDEQNDEQNDEPSEELETIIHENEKSN